MNSNILEICPTATQKWIQDGAVLLDVRERDEVAQLAYDVPELIHIPISELEERFRELPTDRHLVVVCRSGVRSLKATYFLRNNGYDKVVNMKHGILRWAHKGFPLKGDIAGAVGEEAAGSSSCCGSHKHEHAHSGGGCCG